MVRPANKLKNSICILFFSSLFCQNIYINKIDIEGLLTATDNQIYRNTGLYPSESFEDNNILIKSKTFRVTNGKLVSENSKKSLDYFLLIDDFSYNQNYEKSDIKLYDSAIKKLDSMKINYEIFNDENNWISIIKKYCQ